MPDTHTYRGPLRAVVLDWAGTTIDYGSLAPALVFQRVFTERGVPVTADEARAPMGLSKRDHIQTMLRMPRVAALWQQAHGQPWTEADIDELYHAFLPLQIAESRARADLIPGTAQAIDQARQRGLRIASTTGYTRAILDAIRPLAAEQGYVPDVTVTGDEVHAGRPAPWMILACCQKLDVYPLSAVVKVDDTLSGIEAGRAAGCWTVGVALSGNLIGLSLPEWLALSPVEQDRRARLAEHQLRDGGAHEVIPTVADLPAALDRLQRRLSLGESPL